MARVVEAEVAEATTAATAAATVGAAVAVTAAEERRWPSGGRAAPRGLGRGAARPPWSPPTHDPFVLVSPPPPHFYNLPPVDCPNLGGVPFLESLSILKFLS